jgi:hypothetical protein
MKTPYVEQGCTIQRDGRTFEAGGAVVTGEWLIAYPGSNGVLNDWHGNALGTWRTLSSWRVQSYISSRIHSIEARVNGVRYVGRGVGEGMSLRAKRSPRQ